MKIQTIPITHKIKHLQPIFTIAKSSSYFVSGGVNGETKLWDLNFNFIKTIKKHSGSVTCVRFSIDSKLLATSGDDGKVYIYNLDFNVIKTIKHTTDITHIEWTPDFILSSDLNGDVKITRLSDFSEYKTLKHHNESVLGIALSSNFKYFCSYSLSKIVLYDDFNIKVEKNLEKGIILENLNSKISFSPNNRFISVGLQFNKKKPTVDILDLSLDSNFSLVGHAAPSEITCFCPFTFKNIQKFYVLAVASQDLSISFWNTMNPKPFLLLKNFTESPILDMFWDSLTLYVCSYDGIVKAIAFEEKEFGEKIESGRENDDFELPFNDKNIEMQKNYEKRVERLDFDEKIEFVRLTPFTINGEKLEDFIMRGSTNKQENTGPLNSKGKGKNKAVKTAVASGTLCNESINLNDTTYTSSGEYLGKAKANAKQTLINSQGGACGSTNTLETSTNTIGNPLNESLINKTIDITGVDTPDNTNSREIVAEDVIKPKRLTPVMMDKPKNNPVVSRNTGSYVVLYDTNQPEKLKMVKSTPFKAMLNDFTIELKEDGTVQVYRATKFFYKINGPCNKVCFNESYLVLYTTHVQIYDLSTGCLSVPFIFIKLGFLDILNSSVLLLDVYGDFNVIDLNRKKSVVGKLAKTKDLVKIQLSRTHFIVAEYGNKEIVFFHRKMKAWFSTNPNFNSITTSGVDFLNDYDDTMAELELTFVHYNLLNDKGNMNAVLKQFVSLVKRMKILEEFVEYKIEGMLSKVSSRKTLELLLEELNREIFLQKFVFKMCRKFKINFD